MFGLKQILCVESSPIVNHPARNPRRPARQIVSFNKSFVQMPILFMERRGKLSASRASWRTVAGNAPPLYEKFATPLDLLERDDGWMENGESQGENK
jgi:hypothetical protein